MIIQLRPTKWRIDVADTAEARTRPSRLVDGLERIPRPVLIRLIPRDAIGVIVRLDDLRPGDVLAVFDPEAGFLVEGRLGEGKRVRVPGEAFGTDAGECGDVGVVAAVDEREAEVDVVLAAEHLAPEQEVAAVEAGEVLGLEDQVSTLVLRDEGQVRSRRWV